MGNCKLRLRAAEKLRSGVCTKDLEQDLVRVVRKHILVHVALHRPLKSATNIHLDLYKM